MELIKEVPINTKGGAARFYADRVEFNDKTVLYSEIEALETRHMVTINRYVGIPLSRAFDGTVFFIMSNGKKQKIDLRAVAMFGIPIMNNPQKYEELYPELFEAIFSIVAKSMAQKYIDMIKEGATVEVAGLAINSTEAKPTKKSKKPVIINKDNYRDFEITKGDGVAIYDKPGNLIWQSSFVSNKNAFLIPHIFNAIFA